MRQFRAIMKSTPNKSGQTTIKSSKIVPVWGYPLKESLELPEKTVSQMEHQRKMRSEINRYKIIYGFILKFQGIWPTVDKCLTLQCRIIFLSIWLPRLTCSLHCTILKWVIPTTSKVRDPPSKRLLRGSWWNPSSEKRLWWKRRYTISWCSLIKIMSQSMTLEQKIKCSYHIAINSICSLLWGSYKSTLESWLRKNAKKRMRSHMLKRKKKLTVCWDF